MQQSTSGTLVFLKPIASDAGHYQCFAENDYGVASSNAVTLKNAFVDTVEETEMKVVEANLGSPVRLTCNVPNAYPKLDVFWSKEKLSGAIRIIRDPRMTVDPEGHLCISKVLKEDEFKNDSYYACFMTSKLLNRFIMGNKVQLKVLPPVLKGKNAPVQQYVSKDQSTLVGDKTEFYCIFGGNPTPEILWKKNGKPVNFTDRVKLERNDRSLSIYNTTELDKGTYSCTVSNGLGITHVKKFSLIVEKAPYFLKEIESSEVAVGNDVTFECEIDGIPEPKVEWTFNSKPIAQAPENPHRTVTSGAIIIRKVSENDIGNYGCNASNSRGYVYKDFFLDVIYTFPETTEDEVTKLATETTETVTLTTETTETQETPQELE